MQYKIGDKVRVVNYGSLILHKVNGKFESIDLSPEIIGKEGVISKALVTQDVPSYAIDGIPGKHAWYDEEQLEMINPNPNYI